MKNISLQTVEKLIFFDVKIKALLPTFKPVFDQWQIGLRGGINRLVKQSLVEFIQQVTSEHLEILQKYWGEEVILETINSSIVKNYSEDVDGLENLLLSENNTFLMFSLARDKDKAHITFWR